MNMNLLKTERTAIRLCASAVVLCISMLCATNTLGQSGAGSIQGTVTDASGAVLPAASIHVVQQGTNLTFDTKSNGEGFYQVPDLFTGTYGVTITASGFKSYTSTIELLVAQNAVLNAALTPGSVSQQVQVSAYVVDLTTTDSGVLNSTIENQRINQLPMNGRFLLTLVDETTPGLESGGASGAAGARLNGLEQAAVEYEVDGAPLSDREFGGVQTTFRQTPDPDSVQEFRIETSDAGADYTLPGTGILTTKSGTNSLHGSLFETARNNGLGIAKQRQNPANYSAPQLVRNEYGASGGGPIVLPHIYHGKNKSFWFLGWENYSQVANTYVLQSVPTLAMRGGDFSGLINSTGTQITLYDPATTVANAKCPAPTGGTTNNTWCRTPFPTVNGLPNQIPTTRESPTAKILLDITPPPTTADNPLILSNYSAPDLNDNYVSNYTFRLDHAFNDNNRVFLRNTIILGTQLQGEGTVAADGIPAAEAGGVSHPSALYATAIGFTHVFSPTFYSETVASVQWLNHRYIFAGNVEGDFESQLGLPDNFGERGFPNFTGLIDPLTGDQSSYWVSQILGNLDENLTKIVGKHQMQFGGRFRHERFGSEPDQSSDVIAFSAEATALENPGSGKNYTATPTTGYADGDEFLGAASSYSVTLEPPYQHFHDMEFDGYFQDDYHISRRFTANLGVRYEAHPSPWLKYGIMQSFDLKNDAMALASPVSNLISEGYTTQAIITNDVNDGAKFETPQEAGMNPSLLRSYDFTLEPRVSLAYQPFGTRFGTVIRGGYGRYIYPEPVRYNIVPIQKNNPFTASYSESYISAAQSPDGLPNYLMRSPQSVEMGVNSSGVVNSTTTTSILPGSANLFTDNYDDAPNYVTEINATVEQALKGNSALRVSWVLTHGTNLDQVYKYNNHPSNYVWEMETGTIAPTGGASTIGTNQYAATATGPYDQTTWGSGASLIQKSGWSTDNALQADYHRLYHNGLAYQINYAWSKPFRVGGYYQIDNLIYPTQNYTYSGLSTMTSPYGTVIAPAAPPARPTGTPSWASFHALDRFENYNVDTAIPKQHIQFNGIYDLPFGRGKRFLSNSNRLVDDLVGGFQLAGDGSIVSQDFSVGATNWGPTNPIRVYRHKAPITDCRSGVCRKAYLWFNGYLAPTVTTGVAGSVCTTNCVSGLPTNYAPYQTPIDVTPGTTYYGDNEVNITLPGGTPSAIPYVPSVAATSTSTIGDNPFAHTVLNGPFNYNTDASLFKVLPITERVRLRFNMDVFNALNVQGFNNPSTTDGTEQLTSSYSAPRQIQLTLRLTF